MTSSTTPEGATSLMTRLQMLRAALIMMVLSSFLAATLALLVFDAKHCEPPLGWPQTTSN